jgi:Protein of unknown function (DUF3305)
MVEEQLNIGLVVERRAATGEWGTVSWAPVLVFETPPEVAAWTPLGGSASAQRFYAGVVAVTLYSTETANYVDNLATGAPQLWVVLRAEGDTPPIDVVAVTADPAEGEAFTEPGIDNVSTLPMPAEMAAFIAQFIADHHVERVFEKRKRDKTAAKEYGRGGLHAGPTGTGGGKAKP